MTVQSLSASLAPSQTQIEAGNGLATALSPLKSPFSPSSQRSPRSPRLRRRTQSILKRPPPLRLSRTLNPFAPRDIILVLSPPPPTTTTRGSRTGTRSGKIVSSGRIQTGKRSGTPLVTSPHVHFPPSAKLTSLIVSSSRFPLSSISSASSRYSDEEEGHIIVSPNPPLENGMNEKENLNFVKPEEKNIPPFLDPSVSASPSFYQYPDSPYPLSGNDTGSPASTASSHILSSRLPFSPAPNQNGVNDHSYTGLRLFETIHSTLATLDNESSRQPVQLDKALKSYPRSPYPTATFDFDHHKPGDSEKDNDEDMDTDATDTDKVQPLRHVPVRANTIAVPATHTSRGRDSTIKALGSHSSTVSVGTETTGATEKDAIMTPVASSIPISIAPGSASASCATSVSASSNLDTVDVPAPAVLSPKSVASNTSIISGISGTSSLRNDFWQSLSFEEGLREEDEEGLGEEGILVQGTGIPPLLLLGAPPPPKLTSRTAEKIQVSSPSAVVDAPIPPDTSAPAENITSSSLSRPPPAKLGKEFDMISRPNLPTPPMLLGTKDGDISRWPDTTSISALDSSFSRSSQLVDVPLSPFNPPHAQVLQRISARKQARVAQTKNKNKEPRLTLSLDTPTESEWISWKSELYNKAAVVTSPSSRTAKDQLPSFTMVSGLSS
ncbi:hypothetical protein K435DRAFT_969942 [Dendrothele bispora CBS 962.96]|uniref:Uncharacterized protein n=1 Tax=Dendrothele bispora (strain CBS 962.96) TaxID=1314807 RepID=A0A4S8LEE7_DENBC|nr:hypothetical protein K435DRAFT_969942 [Dendrothele bispora CBS 962.96]